jgi:hypothetical protein
MSFYWLTLGILAVWRLTHLFNAEDGPWDILVRLRKLVGNGFWGKLLDCFQCLSVWIAVPFAYWLGNGWKERFLLWPALSAGCLVVERLILGCHERDAPKALYFEEPEDPDVMLRK